MKPDPRAVVPRPDEFETLYRQYSREVWASAYARWMDADLARVGPRTPVIIVTHDQPEAEAKHFINPNGRHDVNATDRFENLLGDVLADGTTIETEPRKEQAAFEAFLRKHPNVTAYFHGNSNWNQFYDWTGPGHSVGARLAEPTRLGESGREGGQIDGRA